MDLKIFKAGKFTEGEFNDFCNGHIIVKYYALDSGDIYLLYKNFNEIGKRKCEKIDHLDRILKSAEEQVENSQVDIHGAVIYIKGLEEKKKGFKPNQGEWKKLDDEIRANDMKIKMAQDTIAQNMPIITGAQDRLKELLAEK